MKKSPDAFRTISEVERLVGTPAHVLRYWESHFDQLNPVKRRGNRRYYRPTDINLISGLKKLIHEDGMTIKGAQKMLHEHGVAAVSNLNPIFKTGTGNRAKSRLAEAESTSTSDQDGEDPAAPSQPTTLFEKLASDSPIPAKRGSDSSTGQRDLTFDLRFPDVSAANLRGEGRERLRELYRQLQRIRNRMAGQP